MTGCSIDGQGWEGECSHRSKQADEGHCLHVLFYAQRSSLSFMVEDVQGGSLWHHCILWMHALWGRRCACTAFLLWCEGKVDGVFSPWAWSLGDLPIAAESVELWDLADISSSSCLDWSWGKWMRVPRPCLSLIKRLPTRSQEVRNFSGTWSLNVGPLKWQSFRGNLKPGYSAYKMSIAGAFSDRTNLKCCIPEGEEFPAPLTEGRECDCLVTLTLKGFRYTNDHCKKPGAEFPQKVQRHQNVLFALEHFQPQCHDFVFWVVIENS